ncbi:MULTISPECIES: hypothetical protein [Megasphaera]
MIAFATLVVLIISVCK